MKPVKKLLYAFLIITMLSPYTAFAHTATEYYETVDLYDSDPVRSKNDYTVTEEDIEFMEDFLVPELKNRSKNINLTKGKYKIPTERFSTLWSNYLGSLLQNDHPEMFYSVEDCKIESINGYITKISPGYTMDEDEIRESQAIIDDELKEIESLIGDDMTDLEKILVVHDYIVLNYEYDTSYNIRTLDEMIKNKKGVCQGYSYLFKYVMDNIGIECVNVPSYECNHMWNKVKVDGEWYNIDLTFDDPLPDRSTNILHRYFLLNDEEIKVADPSQHSTWDAYKWDGTRPVEVSESTVFSQSAMQSIHGISVCKNGSFYCFDSANNICVIDFANGTLTPVYTDSYHNSNILTQEDVTPFTWFMYGTDSSFYSGAYSSMVMYKGDIYFNSPDKIYKFNTADNSAELIYEYPKEDISNTYFYGTIVKKGTLFAQYSTHLGQNIEKLIAIPVSSQGFTPTPTPDVTSTPDPDATPTPTPDPDATPTPTPGATPAATPPCSSSISGNDRGEITVELTIPDEVKEQAVVYIAKYDENGLFIGFAPRAANELSITFTPENGVKQIKTFIWNISNKPLANLTLFNIPAAVE